MPFPTAAFAVNYRRRLHAELAAAYRAPVAGDDGGGQPLLLRLGRRALRAAAGRLGGGERAAGQRRGPCPRPRRPHAASRRCVAAAVVVDVAVLGLFAYHGFFLGSVTDVFDALGLSAGPDPRPPGPGRPVGRHPARHRVRGRRRGGATSSRWPWATSCCTCTSSRTWWRPAGAGGQLVPQFHEQPDPVAYRYRRLRAVRRRVVRPGRLRPGYLGASWSTRPSRRPRRRQHFGALAVALYAFAVQIYAGFSGLTDIAVGCALLLGVSTAHSARRAASGRCASSGTGGRHDVRGCATTCTCR